MTSTVRAIKILKMLENARYPLSISELADYFGVSERAIQRDAAAIREAGVDVAQAGHNNPTLELER